MVPFLKVQFKKTLDNAVIPAYAKLGDAGLDLTAASIIEDAGFKITYDTGLAVEIPMGYVGLVFPRSSVRKYQIDLSNAVGVIDSSYRGSIQFTFNKLAGLPSKRYEIGDRIGQLLILAYPTIIPIGVDELSESERGTGGFGSTGS